MVYHACSLSVGGRIISTIYNVKKPIWIRPASTSLKILRLLMSMSNVRRGEAAAAPFDHPSHAIAEA
jgi:hypothetical protein